MLAMMPVKSQPPSKQFSESLSGLIERVTFHNDDNLVANTTLPGYSHCFRDAVDGG